MRVIDLKLQRDPGGAGLAAFVSSPLAQESFLAPWPAEALEWLQEWQRQFLAHHDPAAAAVSADAVRDYGVGLSKAMGRWLAAEPCRPLREALTAQPELPLRVRIEGPQSRDLERLPWEVLEGERTIWRLVDAPAAATGRVQRARRPRLLLLVGSEEGLSLEAEVERLEQLQRRGRLELSVLRGGGASLAAIRRALVEAKGWDALVFLGHSEADPNGGGRLHLGDGSWVAADALRHELQSAARSGLALVLLNSCSGLDLARSCAAAGIRWAVCFREPVPCRAASLAFGELLSAMERGADLFAALRQAGQLLTSEGPEGSGLLLSLVGNASIEGYRLPLRKRKQLLLRLARSTPAQAISAAVLVAVAAVGELAPATPLNAYLLDRRLYVQRHWRSATGQTGPQAAALPVLVLDQTSAPALGATATAGRASRDLLTRVLRRTPVDQVPVVGLDLALDEQAPFSDALAQVIREQRRPLVFAGFFGEQVEGKAVGKVSRPLPSLLQAGLQARDLAAGIPASSAPLKTVPLQLAQPITAENFAGTLAGASDRYLPADAVLDWSLDWRALLRRVELQQLGSVRAPALLVGSDGTLDRDGDDLFAAPGAMDPQLTALWQGSERKLPGVLLQAVLAQSLRLGHWLTPASQSLCTALAAGLGVLLAAAQADRWRRLWIVGAIIVVALPLSWQLAVSTLWLVPVALPLAALSITALCRRD